MKAFPALLGVALVAVLSIALAGCGVLGGGRNEALDGNWQLESFGDAASPSGTDPGSVPAMTLDGGDVSGYTGVNTFSGSYTWRGDGTFEFGPLTYTEMGGSPAAMAQERAFLDALEATRRYEVVDTKLRLSDAEGGTLLVLVPAP